MGQGNYVPKYVGDACPISIRGKMNSFDEAVKMAYAKWDKQVQALHDERSKYNIAMLEYQHQRDLEETMKFVQIKTGQIQSPCYPSAYMNPAPTPCVAAKTAPAMKRKGKTMYDCDYDCGGELTETQQTKNHLISRLGEFANEKESVLRKAYGLQDDERPKTPREFLDRVTQGKFVISDENMNKNIYYFEDAVRWRDPSVKKDEAGFKLAATKVEDARTDSLDEIMVKTPEQGLDILKAFKATAFN